MSDNPLNHELDDELLSAYLDGELSADERSAVEARLATEPAAQQVLHELRSVSQSVQALPTESLGRDLSEDVLRRAREAKPTPAAAEMSSGSADAMPKIKIFGSRRAWFWASMALAAGLLIMIVQSGDEPNKKLSPVASHDRGVVQNQPTDESGQPARREPSIFAAPKPASPPPSAVASDHEAQEKLSSSGTAAPTGAPMSGLGPGGRLSGSTRDGAATGPPLAAATPAQQPQKEERKTDFDLHDESIAPTAAPSQVALDKLAVHPEPSGGPGGPLDVADAKQKSELTENNQPLIVVRVIAKRAAIQNGSFDRLLAANKIELEPQLVERQSLSLGAGKTAKQTESESLAKQRSKKAEDHAADVVFVEAPPSKIESCLTDLNNNSSDFLSVAVNEQPQSGDLSDAISTLTPTTKLGEDLPNLSRFNRGAAQAIQKDTVDPRYFFSYQFDSPSEPAAKGPSGLGGFKSAAEAPPVAQHNTNGAETRAIKKQLNPDISRARRLQITSPANRQPGEPASAGGHAYRPQPAQAETEITKQPTSTRKLDEPKANNDRNNNWKVLFVFTPEETPASRPPSDNRQK
jgi:negative regulator of sigma E activity